MLSFSLLPENCARERSGKMLSPLPGITTQETFVKSDNDFSHKNQAENLTFVAKKNSVFPQQNISNHNWQRNVPNWNDHEDYGITYDRLHSVSMCNSNGE